MNVNCKHLARIALAVAGVIAANASAQSSGGPYRIEPVAIAAGGGTSVGGVYQLSSTIGQPVTTTSMADNYVLFTGFWNPIGLVISDIIFINGFDPPF